MSDLAEAKVGDTLLVWSRWNKYLTKVERVTPTGRVITKNAEFNPNGSIRGGSGSDRAHACIASSDDIAGINRNHLVNKLWHFSWDKLNTDDLKTVGEIIARYKMP